MTTSFFFSLCRTQTSRGWTSASHQWEN